MSAAVAAQVQPSLTVPEVHLGSAPRKPQNANRCKLLNESGGHILREDPLTSTANTFGTNNVVKQNEELISLAAAIHD